VNLTNTAGESFNKKLQVNSLVPCVILQGYRAINFRRGNPARQTRAHIAERHRRAARMLGLQDALALNVVRNRRVESRRPMVVRERC
jgi:hypothetical protein